MAQPHHRHQTSLEGIIDFSKRPPLTAAELLSAGRRFRQLVDHFADADAGHAYDRVKLVRLTYEYARSEESKGNFLRAFFDFAGIVVDEDGDLDLADQGALWESLRNFADHLFENFFLPLRASSSKTPQPSPATHSAIQRAQGAEGYNFAGTDDRVSALRGECLIRDRHCCVVSRKFDIIEATEREKEASRQGREAQDDDGKSLMKVDKFGVLEVAHILPHSLTQLDKSGKLDPSKEAALAILNMFDSGAAFLIEGAEIDRPQNAITLAQDLHRGFGEFRIFFKAIDDQPHTYVINAFSREWRLMGELPETRTLHLSKSRSIEPPSPRLLAIHYAIAHILHLSGAGSYIEDILQDLGDYGIRADGSTELDRLVRLRLDGWPIRVN